MQSSLRKKVPTQLKHAWVIGLGLIAFLLLLPSLATLDGEAGNDWAIFFGRFHIVVLHLPIGWLMIIPFLELLARKCALPELKKAIRFILLFASASAILAVVIGLTLASSDGYSGDIVTTHMWLGITTAICTILACLFNESFQVLAKNLLQRAYFASLTTALVAVTWGGHLGGSLVQGEGYLTEKLPTELKVTLGLEKQEELLSYDTPIYQGFIEPMFARQCMSCHNAGKVKGQFKLDTLEDLFKGGKSQKAGIVAGNLKSSEVFHRVTLPRSDDKAMPPEGRTPLTEEQTALMRWWIETGAPTTKTINQLESEALPPEIIALLDDRINASAERLFPTKVFTSVDPIQLNQHIQKLKADFGIDIVPVSQDPKDGLQITAFNFHTSMDDNAWQALSPLAEFITYADFGNMTITELSWQKIGKLPQLRSLLLDNASLESTELASLNQLTRLQVLNLFNTSISDKEAANIAQISSLKKLYLGQTLVTETGIENIQNSLKQANIYHSLVDKAVQALPEPNIDENQSKSSDYAE
ncbi:c-type cytochrome domain-containing protein [Paraglaciecola sp.]|uniref:c-type cytochrome domain-containing protein n=1 Tax=Paraglaciecola sp. TaxID=1920173 RepID=UPI003EF3D683